MGASVSIVDFDRDGWPDFLVTRNNDRALAFRNGQRKGRHSFAVTLRGKPGNPTAVGARITVVLADGTRRASEVAAGSGYFAQSTALAFFGYLDGNNPAEVKVRWPDGQESSQVFSAPPPKILRLAAP